MRARILMVLVLASCASRPSATVVDGGGDRESVPLLGVIDAVALDEHEGAAISIPAREGARVFLLDAPAGAHFDEPARVLRFTPDFIQGGRTYAVTVVVIDIEARAESTFTITVRDTIHPPDPEVVSTTDGYMIRLVRVFARPPIRSSTPSVWPAGRSTRS
jgi:hypothetical protein